MRTMSLIAILFLMCLFNVQHGNAQAERVPRNVLELRPGGYVYADYPGIFDASEDGITIELWAYFTNTPKDEEMWLIFARPGSYFLTLTGEGVGYAGLANAEDKGTTFLGFGVEKLYNRGLWDQTMSGNRILRDDFPVRQWVNIVCQIKRVEDNKAQFTLSFDDAEDLGPPEFVRFGTSIAMPMGTSDFPLLIGGRKPITMENGKEWHANRYRFESMEGYIDEVSVSKGWRYGEKFPIKSKRRLKSDGNTIALWRFMEGNPYSDSSGNRHKLRVGGSLAVESQGKLATTWGQLKTR